MFETYDYDAFYRYNEKRSVDEFIEYVADTTLAKTEDEVKVGLTKYLANHDCSDDVRMLLQTFIGSRRLLEKTHVVCDGSYRNYVILVRPDQVSVSNGPCEYDDEDVPDVHLSVASWLVEDAPIIHLNMTSETWSEFCEWARRFDTYDPYDGYDEDEYIAYVD